nr:reverse transcriptase domain-containing protein [Tanacetum cinerariifolium]
MISMVVIRRACVSGTVIRDVLVLIGSGAGRGIKEISGGSIDVLDKDGLSAIATNIGTPLMLDSYTSDMRIQSWGRSSYARALIEVRADVELKDNIMMAMPKLVWRGSIHVMFVLNMNGNLPDVRVVRLIIDGTATLVDDNGKPLTRVDSLSDHDSDDEFALVDNDMANFLPSKDVGYGTNSLLEQWKESYGNGEYNYDPSDDYMYEGQNIPDKIQGICDNLDIKVRGRKKK